jgi:hypothetical protein
VIDYRCGRRDALMSTPSRAEPFLCHTLTFDGASDAVEKVCLIESPCVPDNRHGALMCLTPSTPHTACPALRWLGRSWDRNSVEIVGKSQSL